VCPSELDLVRVRQQTDDGVESRDVRGEQRGGIESVEVEADEEELVASAEDE
jgi:hypothetical protein